MIPKAQVRQVFFLLLMAALFGLVFWNLLGFVPALLGAYTLYVLLRQPLAHLTEARSWNKKAAVAALMLAAFAVVMLPVMGLAGLVGAKVKAGFHSQEQLRQSAEMVVSRLEAMAGFEISTPERIAAAAEWAFGQVSGLLNATLGGLLMVLVAFLILWFMLMGGKRMEQAFFSWLPLREENIGTLRRELNDLVWSNAVGIPLMGAVQSLAGLVGYSLAGVGDLWFWVLLTFVAGMLPFVGVMLAYVPLSLVLFSKGETGAAAFVLAYGFLVIGSIDNLARMWLLKKIGNAHPLVTLFGVVVGLKVFGFVGFVFGPILISMSLLLAKIYTKEFG